MSSLLLRLAYGGEMLLHLRMLLCGGKLTHVIRVHNVGALRMVLSLQLSLSNVLLGVLVLLLLLVYLWLLRSLLGRPRVRHWGSWLYLLIRDHGAVTLSYHTGLALRLGHRTARILSRGGCSLRLLPRLESLLTRRRLCLSVGSRHLLIRSEVLEIQLLLLCLLLRCSALR